MTRARHIAACLASSQRDSGLHKPLKTCAASTCGEQVAVGHVYCSNHWHFLPLWLRRAILNTFEDGEWSAHQEAIRQASDFIDNAHRAARDAGYSHVVSARLFDTSRSRGKQLRFMGKMVA